MNIVIAIDSLKGSLTSLEAGNAIKQGILCAMPDANVRVFPIADGGEGTVSALTSGMGGSMEIITVTGPLGTPVKSSYGILPNHNTAVIEMAAAAGITLVPEEKRNPLHTTTYGVGELIRDAISKGCRHFIIGIGGSATNDGGIGMLQALGYDFLDQKKQPIPFGAKGLKDLAEITDTHVLPELKDCTFRIACDVKNPLCGSLGCSAVFAPQKGADPAMIPVMDTWLSHFAEISSKKYKKANPDHPGAGAAGGLGFAFWTFTNAVLESGIDIILEETNLESYVKTSDIVITGEGRLDAQTVMGKAPSGVARIAKKYKKPVLAFCGCATEDANICNEHGIDAYFPILRNISTQEEAMNTEQAEKNLRMTAEQVFRLMRCMQGNIDS